MAVRADLLRTPFPALVASRLAEVGRHVAPGEAVVRLQDVSAWRVEIGLPASLAHLLVAPEDLTALVAVPRRGGQLAQATYLEHSTDLDPVSQTYRVAFRLDPEWDLVPGETATLRLRLDGLASAQASRVPSSALDKAEDGRFRVWLLDRDGRTVRIQDVTVLRIEEDGMAVVEGLRGDETMVTAGFQQLEDGMVVRPTSAVR